MGRVMQIAVQQDSITDAISQNFDYEFDGISTFNPPAFNKPNEDFQIGLIVGPSGTGKSTLLKRFGHEEFPLWEHNKAIVSHFPDAETAQERLAAVGFNSIPSWFRPYHVLSTGEQYRADLARRLDNNVVVDEFTSVVDRSVAKSAANAVSRYIRKSGLTNVVFASCHYDIIEWLQPDWVFDTATGQMRPRGCLRRPTINLELLPCGIEAWSMFSAHHYLTENINKSAKFWLCVWGTTVVGFGSAISYPSGTVKNAFRGHRTVVLPDYQGLGIGVRISDAIAEMYVSQGCRYFSKTVHPRMGEYRNNSALWKPTSKNMKRRRDKGRTHLGGWAPRDIVSYSHEYIGNAEN